MSCAICDAEQLLHIQIGDRPVPQRLQSVISDISLQLHQIERPPGAEQVIFSTPLPEFLLDIHKGLPFFQFVHLQMDQLPRNVVHLMVDLRLDQLRKLADHLSFAI